MIIEVNKIKYEVCEGEFEKIQHNEYNNLVILKNVSQYERIISLLTTIGKELNISNCLFYNVNHGGFIPLQCSKYFKKIFITSTSETNKMNIFKNFSYQKIENINFIENINCQKFNEENEDNYIVFSESIDNILLQKSNINMNNFIVSSYSKEIETQNNNYFIYSLSNTNLYLYVPKKWHENWLKYFHYYINIDENTGKKILNYDNLINLCIMVKNGGEQFENMLNKNKHLIDQWTILDTGSTDNTIEIIKKVLNNKKGTLYEEPFINFRDSRNRLLDLAGESCKYILMLDDTYIINGDLREFLNDVRGDQWSDSFSLFIKSDDTEYVSNRIIVSDRKLRYLFKIHEFIQEKNNINVVIPIQKSHIFDERFEYMEERTINRKKLDIKLLFEELEDDPNNPRTYYYLGQTYNLLMEYEKAFHYFIERMKHPIEGFIQEKIDAIFEAARIANFKLNKPWKECEELYFKSYELDKTRPDAIYFIGIHYFLEDDKTKAYNYFKLAYEIGYPIHCQYSLKPTLSYHFLPKFLTQLCYENNNYLLGEKCARLFLDNNSPTADSYQIIDSWHKLFVNINKFLYSNTTFNKNNLFFSFEHNKKPILSFVADGGFNKWSGSTILTKGVGGSETYIIEMANHIQKQGYFQVVVFCNCEESEDFEGVQYFHLSLYFDFIREKYVHTVIISRFSEYYPATILANVDNIYMVAHDLSLTGLVIPIHHKLRKIFCLTEWHVSYFAQIFPALKDYLVPFYYGINPLFSSKNSIPKHSENLSDNLKMEIYEIETEIKKHKNSFIYSSFPNRGLLQLLQMWPKIWTKYNNASLHIYSDIDGEWVNNTEPQMMKEIRELLSYLNKENSNYNIHLYGWVKKSELAEAWKKAEYWFYPCTFMETFCLTALEAALTKTISITNNLAALQNTVGDRGLIIPGNACEIEWQDLALSSLFSLIEDEERKAYLIEKNYKWALNLSWENQAYKLLNEHLLTNQLQIIGMYNWVHDLPPGQKAREKFENVIQNFNLNNKNLNPRVLEVGTYVGISLINIISRIPNSIGIGIDRWEDYNEHNINILKSIKSNQVECSFYHNIEISGLQERIKAIKGDSFNVLLELVKKEEIFDFIYVDGSHKSLDVHLDLFLSWRLLRKGGVLAIDDYMYNYDKVKENPLEYPFEGVNDFLKKHENEYIILSKDYRIFLEKK